MFNFLSKGLVNRISGKEVKRRLAEEKNVFLIDVREKNEYINQHIPNSVNISLGKISEIEKKIPNKESVVVTYCASGSRSKNACVMMKKMGYNNTYNLGGIHNWKDEMLTGKK